MKVGLGISPVTPSAWASPRTHSDFPAPSGPWSRRIVPGGRRGRWRAAWARVAAASGQISSGESLAEVIIAAEGEFAGVKALAGMKAGADGGEWGGEGPAPEKGGDAMGWDGEEKFVVFPLGEGGGGCGAGGEGDLIGVNLKTNMGGASEAGKIGSESVAEVEHGGWKFIAGKPVTLGETWGEGEVAAWPGATEFACDKKEMAWAGAGSVGGVVFGGCSEKRDGDKELAGSNGFPADDGKMELFREEGESAIGLANALGGAGIGATHGDECSAGGGGSGGKVAQGTSESFASDERGGGGGGEVDAFDDGIGF